MGKVKDNALIALTPAADHSDYEGYFVEVSAGEASVCNSATDIPIGVIVDGETTSGKDTIALASYGGTVLVKAAGNVTKGGYQELTAAGKIQDNDGSGARVLVAIACDSAVADELVEVALITPIIYAS
jgi:hypothetical protein